MTNLVVLKNKQATRYKHGYVYIACSESGLTKIGRSTNPYTRLKALQNSSGYKFVKIYTTDLILNYIEIESIMHKYYKEYRREGEWFELNYGEAVDFIEKLDWIILTDEEAERRERDHNIKFEETSDIINKKFFPLGTHMFSDGKIVNLDIFEPTERDFEEHIEQMKEMVISCIENCDEIEWSKKYEEQLREFEKSENKIKKIRLMQTLQMELLDAFDGVNPKNYLSEKNYLFMQKVLGLKIIDA